ncbi:hypothetical protein Dacet_1891 [Denitrovibrio acetiphilus DSM 12809]|uniref:Uncharacterized protein n=1 Tax=Denitrovibrio acetiphilus (strain DSM 12809 / NBRC 114555 / N2460) TaxID=522772 RepID=D4H0Z2_DENA2|nr:hypothetical protein [Denitrovibrio acetiphilus]ADD68655.1 hypothetical protein Dacet_1891 [Denitrovibrio acetiphilus DSM 12809]
MKPSMEFMSNVCSVLGHINENIEEKKVALLLEKKIEKESETYNLLIKGENEADVFMLASELTDEQLKWYVFGLGDGMGLKPEKLEIA